MKSDFDDAFWAARGMAREFTAVVQAVRTLVNTGLISAEAGEGMLARLHWGISPEVVSIKATL